MTARDWLRVWLTKFGRSNVKPQVARLGHSVIGPPMDVGIAQQRPNRSLMLRLDIVVASIRRQLMGT